MTRGFVAASLASEKGRRRSFAANFSDPSQYCIVDSIDGRCWTDAYADTLTTDAVRAIRELEKKKGKMWFRPSAVACAITHRDKLLSEAERNDVILCEDDIRISDDFIKSWQDESVRAAFRQLDGVVLLHYISRSPVIAEKEIATFARFRIYKLNASGIRSAGCYYASPAVARRIREYQTPISCTADHWDQMIRDGVFRDLYAIHPAPASTGGFSSNIGYGKSLVESDSLPCRILRRLRRDFLRRTGKFYEALDIRRD